MRPIVATVGPLAAADATNIAKTQDPTKGALTLNGNLVTAGVAVMDNPRQVLITTTADESKNTFTIHGTSWAKDTITETVTGPNKTTAASVLSYATVTEIDISGNASGNLTVGTNGVGSSPWVRCDEWSPSTVALQTTVAKTANYTVQSTFDDPNSPTNPVTPASVTWVNASDTSVVAGTASAQVNMNTVPSYVRVVLNSGSGSVTMTVTQPGSVTY